jgi:ABC-2 type transport system ATP-binding protein
MTEAPAVVATGLSKRFGHTLAVDRLSITVERGKAYGLVGPDGAGKTTTIRLIAGLLSLDSGSVQVLGIDVGRNPDAVKDRIGYMPQRFALYGDLSVDENIAFFGNLYQVPRRQWQTRADAVLSFSGLAPFRRRLAGQLSGGMKQKLALACTLIHQPDLILLDEPTTGVDPVSRREFWQILYGLLRQGITILVSTPYMDEAERCNTVGFISRGSIRLFGAPAELKASLPHAVLEVRANPQAAVQRLVQHLPAVADAQPFGSALHLSVYDAGAATRQIEEAIHGQNVQLLQIRQVAPSMEDVFFQLARDAGVLPSDFPTTTLVIPDEI